MKKEDFALKCRDMTELVTPYLEGGLPLRTRLAARFHLWLCAACRNYVAQVRHTIRFLGAGPPPKPPENENEIIALLDARSSDR
jgi:anti-sigma factor ChrR (cupin superfamily)